MSDYNSMNVAGANLKVNADTGALLTEGSDSMADYKTVNVGGAGLKINEDTGALLIEGDGGGSSLTTDQANLLATIAGTTANGPQINAAAANLYGYNRPKLKEWDAFLSRMQQATGDVITAAWIGDSWVHNNGAKASTMFAAYLSNRFGDSGAGYVGAQSAAEVTPSPPCGATRPVTVNRTGVWTDNRSSLVGAIPATCTSSAVNATYTFVGTANSIVIHWVKRTGGGSFTYQIDGGGATTVNTSTGAGATPTLGLTTITPTDASHTLLLTVSVAGTAGVELCGVEFNRAKTGSRLHNLGLSGSSSPEWAAADATQWEAAITQLAPSLVLIGLGVNDAGNVTLGYSAITPTNYAAYLQTIITRVLAATASPISIVLLTPGDVAYTTTYPMSAYADAVKALAATNGIGCLDQQGLLGTQAEALARSLYANDNHLSVSGHRMVANFLDLYLLSHNDQQRNLYCTAYGADALLNNSAVNNAAFGANALKANTTGDGNVAIGVNAATSVTTGTNNLAMGYAAFQNGVGICNTAIGTGAGQGYTGVAPIFDGAGNVLIGYFAGASMRGWGGGVRSSYNVLIGHNAGTSNPDNDGNVVIGAYAGSDSTDGQNVIYIGHFAGRKESTANVLIVDNQDRALGASAANSIIYGIMGATASMQELHFNALKVLLSVIPTYANEAAASSLATGTVYKTSTGELRIKL